MLLCSPIFISVKGLFGSDQKCAIPEKNIETYSCILMMQIRENYWSSPGAGPYVCSESRDCTEEVAYGHLQWLCTCAG